VFGRAVLGPLDDAWEWFLRREPSPGGFAFPGWLRVSMSTMRHRGIGSGGAIFFVWRGQQRRQERPSGILLIFQKVVPTPPPARRAKTSTRPRPSADLVGFRVTLRRSPISAHTRRTEKKKPWPPEAQGF
jgi:hypothetical protein